MSMEDKWIADLHESAQGFYNRLIDKEYVTYHENKRHELKTNFIASTKKMRYDMRIKDPLKLVNSMSLGKEPLNIVVLNKNKLASASVKAILQTGLFECNGYKLKDGVRYPSTLLYPNEFFAYFFVRLVIGKFSIKGKKCHWCIPDNYSFDYPQRMYSFYDNDIPPKPMSFDEFMMQLFNYYGKERKFPLFAFSAFFTVLEITNDVYISTELADKYFYEGR